MKLTAGRLSDIASKPHREDWSELNARLRSLQPGEVVSVDCPAWTTVPKLRSAILTNSRRLDYGPWRLSTRTEGHTIHCFLIPTD